MNRLSSAEVKGSGLRLDDHRRAGSLHGATRGVNNNKRLPTSSGTTKGARARQREHAVAKTEQ